ncbi:hypothetical protein Ddc_23516 [Ditylenchus destructor]|nr:hypothetical protein Ddc_23516 [Ditylenchus destructor]
MPTDAVNSRCWCRRILMSRRVWLARGIEITTALTVSSKSMASHCDRTARQNYHFGVAVVHLRVQAVEKLAVDDFIIPCRTFQSLSPLRTLMGQFLHYRQTIRYLDHLRTACSPENKTRTVDCWLFWKKQFDSHHMVNANNRTPGKLKINANRQERAMMILARILAMRYTPNTSTKLLSLSLRNKKTDTTPQVTRWLATEEGIRLRRMPVRN